MFLDKSGNALRMNAQQRGDQVRVTAYQTAFHQPEDGPVKVRPIDIPDSEVGADDSDLLERAFYYGQNDFQPRQGFYSVSVGDVVELAPDRRYRCMGSGWKRLEADEDPLNLTGREANKAGYGF
jgi:hypothetical protein